MQKGKSEKIRSWISCFKRYINGKIRSGLPKNSTFYFRTTPESERYSSWSFITLTVWLSIQSQSISTPRPGPFGQCWKPSVSISNGLFFNPNLNMGWCDSMKRVNRVAHPTCRFAYRLLLSLVFTHCNGCSNHCVFILLVWIRMKLLMRSRRQRLQSQQRSRSDMNLLLGIEWNHLSSSVFVSNQRGVCVPLSLSFNGEVTLSFCFFFTLLDRFRLSEWNLAPFVFRSWKFFSCDLGNK